MNKTIITGIVALLLSLITGYFEVAIVPVILFGIGIILLLHELINKIFANNIDESIKVIKVKPKKAPPEDLDQAINKIIESPEPEINKEVVKTKVVTPKKSTGTKLVKPLVEEQLTPEFVKSVKKTTPKRKPKNTVAKSKTSSTPKKRKPRVKKEK